jgi:hypothetical protein
MSNKYSVNHVEYGIIYTWDEYKYGLSILVNRPITTIELSYLPVGENPIIYGWGISYCRPDDNWNPVLGISKAATNLMEKYKLSVRPSKDFVLTYWNAIEPIIDEVNGKCELANKRAMKHEEDRFRKEWDTQLRDYINARGRFPCVVYKEDME